MIRNLFKSFCKISIRMFWCLLKIFCMCILIICTKEQCLRYNSKPKWINWVWKSLQIKKKSRIRAKLKFAYVMSFWWCSFWTNPIGWFFEWTKTGKSKIENWHIEIWINHYVLFCNVQMKEWLFKCVHVVKP